MREFLLKKFKLFSPAIFLISILASCSSTQKIKYFQDIPDSGVVKTIPAAPYNEPKVQVGDLLNVNVQTLDPLATQMVNMGNTIVPGSASTSSTGGTASAAALSTLSQQQTTSGYMVDKNGTIDIPILGKISVVNHTTSELKEIIKSEADKYYKDPVVIVRLINFSVSVTGEVLKPGVYVMPTEKVSIINAIAMAGDLTIFGKRENVLLIRENVDGTKTAYRINLKKSDIMSSPIYYLRQNDIIYVEPRKAKSDATDAAQTKYIGLASAFITILIVLLTRIK